MNLVAEVKHGPRGGKKANTSELMRAIETAQEGEVVNACPFGCEDEDLDDRGYCKHLVGITVPGDKTRYEPVLAANAMGRRVVSGKKLERVRAGDKLLRITTSHRVYRAEPDAK